MAVHIGDEAPDYLGKDQSGNAVYLHNYKGKKVALYFYPKDNTPGCSAQACSLRDGYQALLDAGYDVIGVSKDSEASHQNFIAKKELPFTLISDTECELQKQFGVWGEKKMCGRTYMGTIRTTFIIDEAGHLEKVITKVKTKDAANQILELNQ